VSETHLKSFHAKAFVVTVSDTRSSGINRDTVGPLLAERLRNFGFNVGGVRIVPDERDEIADLLINLVDVERADFILTTGGTGLSPRDVTPEATRDVIHREIPGFGECMRLSGADKTPMSWLSRATAGIRGSTIIMNVPGSERGAMESLESILPMIRHAIEIVRGEAHECGGKPSDNG